MTIDPAAELAKLEAATARIGYIVVDSWAGRFCCAVDVLRETKKRYWVRLHSAVSRHRPAGHEQFVQKSVVRDQPPSWAVGERAPEYWQKQVEAANQTAHGQGARHGEG